MSPSQTPNGLKCKIRMAHFACQIDFRIRAGPEAYFTDRRCGFILLLGIGDSADLVNSGELGGDVIHGGMLEVVDGTYEADMCHTLAAVSDGVGGIAIIRHISSGTSAETKM